MGWCKLLTLSVGQPSWISPTRWLYFLSDRSGVATGERGLCPRDFPRVEQSLMPSSSPRTEGFQATEAFAEVEGHPLASEELHVKARDYRTPEVLRLWEGQAAGKGLEMEAYTAPISIRAVRILGTLQEGIKPLTPQGPCSWTPVIIISCCGIHES